MWTIEVYRLLAAEKIGRAQKEAQHDRLVREAAAHVPDGAPPPPPAIVAHPAAPRHAQKEEPQTA